MSRYTMKIRLNGNWAVYFGVILGAAASARMIAIHQACMLMLYTYIFTCMHVRWYVWWRVIVRETQMCKWDLPEVCGLGTLASVDSGVLMNMNSKSIHLLISRTIGIKGIQACKWEGVRNMYTDMYTDKLWCVGPLVYLKLNIRDISAGCQMWYPYFLGSFWASFNW